MLIDDEVALRDWLVATLEPLCDAEPIALARYVLALITKDKPLDKLRENCIDRLEVFLDRATKDFVDQLFEVIGNGRYIPEAKKENVQPKASETNDDKSGDSSENLEPQTSTSPTRQENEQEQIPSTSHTTASSDYSSTTASSSSQQQQSSGAAIQSVKRRYPYRSSSGRHHSPNPPRRHVNNSSGGANRHQQSSHYRSTTNSSNQRSHRSSSRSRSGSPPPAKRSQRSYSHSSSGSSSRSSPSRQTTTSNTTHQQSISNTNFLYKKMPCTSYFENKGYCAQGDACPYDHGTNNVPFDQQQHQQQQQQQQQAYYPSYQQYGIPPGHLHPHYHEYNPEAPDLKHAPHQGPPMFMRHPMHHHPRMPGPPLAPGQMPPSQQQMMMMNPQRTLVTVVTNAEPLPLEQKLRQNDSMSVPNSSMPPIMHAKRHISTGPYPNERRPHHHHHQQQQQQHDHSANNESNNQNNSNNTNNNNNPSNTNNGYNNRGWKRPWQKPDASGSAPATLEIRKIPVESNTISKLNEHFSKFGTVTNVQIAYDGAADSALVAYATLHEAETAYKNPEPLFNNRFIKIFWHNNNKNQSSGNNNNNNNSNQNNQQQSSSDGAPTKKSSSSAPNPMKLHWMKMQQMSGNKSEQSAAQPAAPAPTTSAAAVPTPPPPPAAAATTTTKKPVASVPTVSKKDAAKKAVLEIHRKKQGLLEEQIQQQKLLLKKLETAETNTEKESIRSLMKQVDATIVTLKDSLRITPPTKTSTTPSTAAAAPAAKLSQQDLLKKRAQTLQKQLETLRAKTSADMRRAMSSTLSQAPLNLPNISQENDSKTSSISDNPTQITIKNINNLPRNELDEFLKNSGATNIQSGDSDNSLIVIFPSKSHVNQIQKNGLTFQNEKLDLSFADDSLLNTSQKKRTLSETLEDELLGVTSAETANDDDEPNAKRRNQSQTSDVEENDEADDDDADVDDHLLDNNETKQVNLSLSTHDDFEPQDLDDEIQLLDS